MRLSILLLLTAALSLDAQTTGVTGSQPVEVWSMIRGRIVDADAKPVGGARIQVALAERSSLDFADAPSVISSDDGRYEIAAPPFEPTETASLVVQVAAHAPVRSAPFRLGRADRTIDVALPRFEAVTVRVRDASDQPLKDAAIAFASTDETAALPSPTLLLNARFEQRFVRTDAGGQAIVYVVPGAWDFAMKADGYQATAIAERQIKGATTLTVKLQPAFSVRGRVHRDGTAVANAQVFVLGGERVARLHEQRSIATDADGAFEIPDLAPGKYTLSVVKSEELLNRTVEAKAPSTIDVALPPAGKLRARIVDGGTGEPVREFLFTVEDVHEKTDRRQMMQRGESTSDGVVTMTLSSGTYRVSAAAMGYARPEPMEVRVTESEPLDLVITLDRGITVGGRITDERGDPIADASVFFQRAERRSSDRIGPNNSRSANDGTYSVSGLAPGTITAVVRKDGFVPFIKAIDVTSQTTLDVQLDRGLGIEGIVRRGGKPAAGVSVDATTQALGGSNQMAKSDANGRFVLRGLVAARYVVSAYSDDAHTSLSDVDPTKTRELALSLDPKPTAVLYGVVTGIPANPGGKIVRRVVFVQGNDRGVEGMIDEQGSYRIEDAPAGKVYVTAQLESTMGGLASVRRELEVAPGETLRVDLELGGSVAVRGRVTHDGKPVAGVRVVFAGPNGIAASATSREGGAYELTLAERGRYQIFAHSPTMMMNANVHLVRDVRGGETIDVELGQQTVEGIVVDSATQTPLPGIHVSLMPELAVPEYSGGEVITDANGRFQLLTAATGAYRIVAWGRGYAQRSLPLQLNRAAISPVALELARAGELRVRVVDGKSGVPLSAHIAIENVPVRLDRDLDGVTLAGSLAPGRYRMKVVVPGYEDRMIEVTAPGSVEVRME